MKASKPKSIGAAIPSVLQQLGLGKKLKQYEVVESWPKIVGGQIAKVASAERIDAGKLFIRVSRAPWRNELVFLKHELISKINSAMKQDIVKDIIFR